MSNFIPNGYIKIQPKDPPWITTEVDIKVVRSIIGLKHRMGLGIHWTNQLVNELHRPVRRRFDKRTVFAKQVDDIWAADLVDMSSFSRSNKGYK